MCVCVCVCVCVTVCVHVCVGACQSVCVCVSVQLLKECSSLPRVAGFVSELVKGKVEQQKTSTMVSGVEWVYEGDVK